MSSEKKDSDVTGTEIAEGEITESAGTEVAEDDASEADETTPDESVADGESVAVADDDLPGTAFQKPRSRGRLLVAVALAVLLVASAGAAGGVYWWMYRPDQQTNADAQKQAVTAASDGTVALLSYSPESLDKDLANAKAHLTGEFLKYYSQFTDQIVAPAAKQKGVKTEATVARAAMSEMHPDNAVVLVFVNQVTTSKDRPDPALATSSVVVKLTKTDGRWLISEFNPV